MGKLLEWLEGEYRKDGIGEPFKGEILKTLECMYGEERNDKGEMEGWLVNSNRIKLTRITKRQFELIEEFISRVKNNQDFWILAKKSSQNP